jgi:hypothetical protein
MSGRTRYFVVASLLVLTVGVGSGLVAYYAGFQMSTFAHRGGPPELRYVPRGVPVLAFADVHAVMTSELRQKLHHAAAVPENGQREFENETGIDIEHDIDHVVGCLEPSDNASGGGKPDNAFSPPGVGAHDASGAGMVLARGRFNETKIRALLCDHGAHAESYRGKCLLVASNRAGADGSGGGPGCPDCPVRPDGGTPDSHYPARRGYGLGSGNPYPGAHGFGRPDGSDLALAFLEPGLVAVGSARLVRAAIDLPSTGQNITTDEELMNLTKSLQTGNVWAIGRFDALKERAHIPANVAAQIPAITWFSVSGHINGGIRGVISVEARDEEAANNFRDVLRGFLALGKMQAASKPEWQQTLQSLELGGTGRTVSFRFDVPSQVFDVLGKK